MSTPEPSAEADSRKAWYDRGYSDGLNAALMQSPVVPATPPLDVERLARALIAGMPGFQRWMQWPINTANEAEARAGAMKAEAEVAAYAVAREYAALANPTPGTT